MTEVEYVLRHRKSDAVKAALWFAADCYECKNGKMVVHVEVEAAVTAVLALLDEMEVVR